MQTHVWLQLIMVMSGYLKLYPDHTGLTSAFPQVSVHLWKYGAIWDFLTAALLCLQVFDLAFMMVYVYLGVFLGMSLEPDRMYGSSVVQMLPTLLVVRVMHLPLHFILPYTANQPPKLKHFCFITTAVHRVVLCVVLSDPSGPFNSATRTCNHCGAIHWSLYLEDRTYFQIKSGRTPEVRLCCWQAVYAYSYLPIRYFCSLPYCLLVVFLPTI